MKLKHRILIAADLKYISKEELDQTIADVKSCKRLLNRFINYYQSKSTEKFSQVHEHLGDHNLEN